MPQSNAMARWQVLSRAHTHSSLWVLAFWEEGGDRHKAGFDPPAPAQWAAMMSSLSAAGAHQPNRCLAYRGSICIWALLASIKSVRSGPNIDKTSMLSTCVRKRSTVHITNCMIVESSRIRIQAGCRVRVGMQVSLFFIGST